MPELPEVETTRRGIEPHILGKILQGAVVRERRLRQPVPRNLNALIAGQRLNRIERRAKYLLLHLERGTLLIHLGMSGNLRILHSQRAAEKHDHVDLIFNQRLLLRFNDPRRFGLVLWLKGDPHSHPLLTHLGPEPLEDGFNGDYLFQRSRKRRQAIKTFLMDQRIVVGVGNIYANEALFLAGIRPTMAAGRLSRRRCQTLAETIRAILRAAIEQGGTTLKDFVDSRGEPGYFQLQLNVYGRDGEPCPQCGTAIKQQLLGQRSTFHCPSCQKG